MIGLYCNSHYRCSAWSKITVVILLSLLGIERAGAMVRPECNLSYAQERVLLGDYDKARICLEDMRYGDPYNEDVIFLLARTQSWSRRYKEAIALYDQLIEKNPGNADYRLGKAQVYFYKGEYDPGLKMLRDLLAKQSAHVDARKLLVKGYIYKGDFDRAKKELSEAKGKLPDKDWQALMEILASDAGQAKETVVGGHLLRNQLTMGGSYESLSNDYSDWSSGFLSGSYNISDNHKLWGRLAELNRFGLSDYTIGAGYIYKFDSALVATIETDDSPTGNFIPEWSMYGGLGYRVLEEITVNAGYRYASYRDVYNQIATINVESYYGSLRLSPTLYVSYLQGTDVLTLSGLIDLSYYYSDEDYVGILLGYGDQAVILRPSEFINDHVQTYLVKGQHRMFEDWSVLYELGVNIQGASYTRSGFSLGFRYDI